jgi:hypothetical protein
VASVTWAAATLAVLAGTGRPASADAESLCAAGEDGWNVITEASSTDASPTGFLCNYRVDRPAGESGTAITIEYFCSAAEGRGRYDSVAGERDTETFRDDATGVLVTEEGPKAQNPDNPQSDGVFSQFFSEPFTLQEKEWRLLNEQVFATIVVLTNERGVVSEEERFGVTQAEAVARTLADRSRSAAGCAIPATASGRRTPPPSTEKDGGGSPLAVILIVAGALALVVVGGYFARDRLRRGRSGRADVQVTRRPDPGAVDLETPDEHGPEPSTAVGVRAEHDDEGDVTIEDDAAT